MIQVTYGNNVDRARASVIVDEHTTIRDFLEQNNIRYSGKPLHLGGSVLQPEDMDKTFADFGVTDRCFLLEVAKTDNANWLK